jgi:RNA polymerase sigma-70 factor, ECF subfamily
MPVLDSQVAKRFQQGDLEALRLIVDAYQTRLYGMGIRLLGHPDEAADMCQDAFLRAFEKRRLYDSKRPFEPWFFKLAVNVGRERLRRRREIPMGDDMPIQAVAAQGDQDLVKKERQQKVQAALTKLKPKHRESLVLRFESDMSLQEMANTLGISLGTVKSRLNRGLQAFQKAYGIGGGEDV